MAAYRQALEDYQGESAVAERAGCLHELGTTLAQTGRYEEALAALDESLGLYRTLGGTVAEQAGCLYDTGVVLGVAGRHEDALTAYQDAVELYRSLPDTSRQQAACLHSTGLALVEVGRYEEAPAAFQGAEDLCPGLCEEVGQADAEDLRAAWSTRRLTEDGDAPGRTRQG